MAKAHKLKLRMKGGGHTGGHASIPTMRGGAVADDTCPAGTFCMSNTMIFYLLAGVILVLLLVVFLKDNARPSMPTYVSPPRPAPTSFLAPASPAPPIIIQNDNGDDRYRRAPQPLRSYYNGPEFPPRGGLAPIPINIPTQGLPERFQSVGIMTLPDGQVLPLYGRRTATSTDRWNYYTRTDTYNPVPVPITFNKRDCMDDVGCNELMTGEQVTTFGTGNAGKVHIYKMDGPKYIPGIL
jgi:hypothetical protein